MGEHELLESWLFVYPHLLTSTRNIGKPPPDPPPPFEPSAEPLRPSQLRRLKWWP